METRDLKKIIWLASYPKSGNTWFRAFLANLLNPKNSPADINDLEGGPIASNRSLFDDATGLSSSDLTMEEIENLRPSVYKFIGQQSSDIIFHKIHDAFTLTSEGTPLVPAEVTRGAIYFVRNPLDVAVSFAHHANLNFDAMIESMNNNEYAFCNKPNRLHMQLRQKLLTWTNHVRSWKEQNYIPTLVVKYEDMKLNSLATFSKATKFCGLNYTDQEIQEALKKCSFTELQKQEKEKGFREKSPESASFFRKGKIGSWKEELNNSQIKKIISNHRDVMYQLGYLQENELVD